MKLSPIFLANWKRFKSYRRAYYSLIIFLLLFFISLFSEVIANKKPIILIYQKNIYFPFLFFYSEKKFIEKGQLTEANYKFLLEKNKVFKKNINFILFPIIKFGPYEIDNNEKNLKKYMTLFFYKKNNHKEYLRINENGKILKIKGDLFKNKNTLNEIFYKEDIKKILEIVKQRYKKIKSSEKSFIFMTLNKKKIKVKFSSYSGYKIRKGIKIKITPYNFKRELIGSIVLSKQKKVVEADKNFYKIFNIKKSILKCNILEISKMLHFKKTIFQDLFEKKVYNLNIKYLNSNIKIYAKKNNLKFPFHPNSRHILGLDEVGRDVLVRIIYAFRIIILFALILVSITFVLGIIIGGIQGYFAGKIDIFFQRFIEIWASIPFLYVMLLMGDFWGRSFTVLLICYSIFNWIGISYYIRAEFLKLKKQQFVEASKALGLSWSNIIFKQILPNALTPVITFLPFSVMSAIGILSALDYLGYGLPAPTPSWGELLSQAQTYKSAWWLILYPSASLFFIMMLLVFIGEGLREAFNPKKFNILE